MKPYFIADDLSGALDAAAAFHHAGRRVVIALSPADWLEGEAGTVVGITTETRNADAATARAAVEAALAQGRWRGATLVYKKIDSTLRGQVAAELAAVAEALPGTRLLLAPANPAVGRTTRDGILYVQGVPVHETAFGRDPKSPLRSSRMADRLGDAVTRHEIVIPDIATPADFTRAVAAMDAAGTPWLAVGSGGLVHAVAGVRCGTAGVASAGSADASDRMQAGRLRSLENLKLQTRNSRPAPRLLLVAGSAHPLNRTQIDALVAARPVDRLLLDLAECGDSSWERRRPDCIVSAATAPTRSLVVQLPAERLDPVQALEALVTTAVEHLQRTGLRHVFATGGETAFALCARLGVRSLDYVAEVEPGLALARADMPTGPLLLAVKPGGFGDEQTWIRAYDTLRGCEV